MILNAKISFLALGDVCNFSIRKGYQENDCILNGDHKKQIIEKANFIFKDRLKFLQYLKSYRITYFNLIKKIKLNINNGKIYTPNDFFFYDTEGFKETMHFSTRQPINVSFKSVKYRMLGIGVRMKKIKSHTYRITAIVPGSPADRNDLRFGDVIFIKEHLYPINFFWKNAVVNMRIQRHGKIFDKAITPKKMHIHHLIWLSTKKNVLYKTYKTCNLFYIKFWNMHPNDIDWYLKKHEHLLKNTHLLAFDFSEAVFASSHTRYYKFDLKKFDKKENYTIRWKRVKHNIKLRSKYINYFNKISRLPKRYIFILSKRTTSHAWMEAYLASLDSKDVEIWGNFATSKKTVLYKNNNLFNQIYINVENIILEPLKSTTHVKQTKILNFKQNNILRLLQKRCSN